VERSTSDYSEPTLYSPRHFAYSFFLHPFPLYAKYICSGKDSLCLIPQAFSLRCLPTCLGVLLTAGRTPFLFFCCPPGLQSFRCLFFRPFLIYLAVISREEPPLLRSLQVESFSPPALENHTNGRISGPSIGYSTPSPCLLKAPV